MNMQDIKNIIYNGEKVDVECKISKDSLSNDIYKSYSGFANTKGGYIFLGVSEDKKNRNPKERFSIEGVKNAEKQITDFWNTINSKKVNLNILSDEDVFIVNDGGIDVIVICVPKADYKMRPIYVNENPFKGTYKRNHEGDYLAREDEIRAMIRDQNLEDSDSRIIDGRDMYDIDVETLEHYRTLFKAQNPNHVWAPLNDKDFLINLGGYKIDRKNGVEGLTRAGIMMFGKGLSIRDEFENIFMDYRDESNTDENVRWNDRVTYDGTWENNLFNFFMKVMPKLTADIIKPFKLDSQQRVDDTPIHKAVREAFVNLIIHTDYMIKPGTLKIIKRKNGFEFTNPGTLLLSVEKIFAGGNSASRNPKMQLMLRMIGYGDNAGSGIPAILSAWKSEEWVEPKLTEDTELNQVTLTLETKPAWTKDISEMVANVTSSLSLPADTIATIQKVCSYENLGISTKTIENMEQMAKALTTSIVTVNSLDLTALSNALREYNKIVDAAKPISEEIKKLTKLWSNQLEKSAEKSAENKNKSAEYQQNLSKKHKELLAIMQTDKEYSAEKLAEKIGLKSARTRQILKELIEMGLIRSNGKTKGKRYIK